YQATAPAGSGGWERVEHDWLDWKPRYIAPDQEIQVSYRRSDQRVGLYLAFYGRQRQDAELINTQNVMVPQKHPVWREVQRTRVDIDLPDSRLQVRQARLAGSGQRVLV